MYVLKNYEHFKSIQLCFLYRIKSADNKPLISVLEVKKVDWCDP